MFFCVPMFGRQPSYTRAYINIVPFPCVPSRRPQNYVVQHLCLSAIYKKLPEKFKKKSLICLVLINKSPTFASAFGNEGGDRLTSCFGTVLQAFGSFFFRSPFRKRDDESERKNKKNFEKFWKLSEKVLIFASAF